MKHILTIYLLLVPILLLSQQDFVTNVQHFSVDDGLSDRNVIVTFQDSQGFIWLGTRYGLNRFDGHSFQTISKEKNGLEYNIVHHIVEDDEGWLWVFPKIMRNKTAQISFVNTKTLEVQTVEQRFGNKFPIDLKALSAIIKGKNQSILLSGEGKILEYKSGKFHQKYETDKYIKLNVCTKNGKILGIVEWQPNNARCFEFDKNFKVYNIQAPNFDSVNFWAIETNKDDYWIYWEANLYERTIDDKWQKISHQKILNNNSINLNFLSGIYYQESQNFFWYEGEKNFFIFRPYEGVVLDLNKEYPEIAKKSIHNIFFDKNENAWITTDFGIYKIRITKNKFTNYLNQPIEKYDVTTAFSSRALLKSDSLIYACSNTSKGKLINLNTQKSEILNPFTFYQKNGSSYSTYSFYSNLKIGKNQFYTAYEHLLYYEDNKVQKTYTWKNVEKYPMIWTIHQDKQQKIWLGTHDKGIGIIDEDSLNFYRVSNDFKALNSSSIYHFLNYDEENILVASTSGVYVLNKKKGILQRFWNNENNTTKIPHDIIHHIYKDKDKSNRIWLATGGNGLVMCDLSKDLMQIENLEHYTIIDGLSNNVIYAVYEDEYNNLWIPSDYGIIQFNKETKVSKAFTVEDGLPFNEFNRISHYQSDDGQLFFGTMNGFTSFYPKSILSIEDNLNIPLRITNFQQFNGRANELENRTAELIQTSKIVLNPADKFFNLEFALLEYKDANQVKYSYQIEGQSDEWAYLDNNKLRISGLPYGKFILKIRAQGTSGQFSSNVISIPIRVLRPFYLQWWFFLALAFATIFGAYYWFQQRTKALIKRQQILEETVKERTAQIEKDKNTIEKQAEELRSLDAAKSRFFANVSHELRTPLTLILAPIENSLKRNRLENRDFTNLQMAKNNGKLLLKMVNEILDLSKLEAGKLNLKPSIFNGYEHFNNIVENFTPLALEKEIDYQFNFDGNQQTNVKLDKQKLQVVLINLLSNAFKFTPNKGKISVDIQLDNNLIIKVKDSGRGIHKNDINFIFDRFYQTKNKSATAEGGTGIGLALVNELVQLMNGNIEVESELGKGTQFTINIPNIENVITETTTRINEKEDESIFIHAQTNPENSTNQVYLKTEEIAQEEVFDKSATILLVEDNLDLREFIASILSEKHQVITAENGAVGWEKLQTINCDLILSDVMMPVMDGYALLEKVKSTPQYQGLPMILLTAKASIDDKLKALRIGVDDYLTKPFIEDELKVRIQNLLRNAEVRKKTFQEVIAEAEKETDTQQETPKETKEVQVNQKQIVLNEEQQEWLNEVETIILENIESQDFTLEDLASKLHISKRQFFRKIKQYIGLTPNKYIRTIRLIEARKLLENQDVNSVKAAAISVGFKDVTYFSKMFKNEFGVMPSEY